MREEEIFNSNELTVTANFKRPLFLPAKVVRTTIRELKNKGRDRTYSYEVVCNGKKGEEVVVDGILSTTKSMRSMKKRDTV